MLRLLTLLIVLLPILAFFMFAQAAPDSSAAINDATQQQETMRNQTSDVLDQADALSKSPEFLNQLNKESSRLIEDANTLPKTSLPDLPELDAEQLKRARSEIGKLFDQAEQPDVLTELSSHSGPRFYVFVSFSMPDLTLQRLMQQANSVGAPLVFRGLVDNDMNKTRLKIAKLLEADDNGNANTDGGLNIDPTLYERFGVTVVPSFVLIDTPVQPCTQAGCPTPDFARLAGDVTVEYALESMAREVPAMRDQAQALLVAMKKTMKRILP
jgi:conjugal transfer pilus assembly protein TrbC